MRLTLGFEFLLNSLLFVQFFILNNKNTSAETVREDSGNFMMVETPEHDKIPDFLLVGKPDGKTSLIEIDADEGNETIIDRSIAQNPGFCTKCVKDKKYKEYFQIQCTDFEKYLKCQSKCVSSKINGAKTPFECIRNPACVKKCESNCKKLWPASITYDAYCGMMDYVQESPRLNPYDNEDTIKKWIAMFYLARKEKGLIGKDCSKPFVNSPISERDGRTPNHFSDQQFDGYDDNVPLWEITMKELKEAYKAVAMTRQIDWTTDLTYEEPKYECIPWFKRREVAAGNFPRRNTWLLLEDGCQHRAHLFAKHLTEYFKNKFPKKKFEPPHKHFLFGSFHFDNKNAQDVKKGIDWDYHVAPTIKVTDPSFDIQNTLWILDPALSPKPLSKADYHQKFNKDGKINGYVTCDYNSYSSRDQCLGGMDNENPFKILAVSYFDGELLNSEWLLQSEKGRNPKNVLGDKWKVKNYYVFK